MFTLIVGAQYGGEGKGKIASYIATQESFDAVCRCGGPNSKHTVVNTSGNQFDLRILPTACAVGYKGKVIYGAGFLMHPETLFEEMELLGISSTNILIDSQTGIITSEIIASQRKDKRYKNIGSTLTGTGYAMAERAMRKLKLAQEIEGLRLMVGDSALYLNECVESDKNVLVEGHQSAGLSNFHGDYPYVSSRDSTAAALLSELGVGPRVPMRIILVVKVFPTRNHSGSLPNEIKIQEAREIGIEEYGGGSWGIQDNRRRVARIDIKQIKRAVLLNTPTEIALTGIDYLDKSSKQADSFSELSKEIKRLIFEIEETCHVPVTILSIGPETDAVIKK